jgi:hypothetical protein
MDNCCNTDSSVVAGIDNKLHNGRLHSHHTGDCHYRCDSRLHSGATRIVKYSPLVQQNYGNGRSVSLGVKCKLLIL